MTREELLHHLDDAALATLVDTPLVPLMTAQVRHLGGALTEPSDSPHGPLPEPYALYLFGVPSDPATVRGIEAKQRELLSGLPVAGRKPVTFLNRDEQLADALPAAAVERLRRIKTERDPDGGIRSNLSAHGTVQP